MARAQKQSVLLATIAIFHFITMAFLIICSVTAPVFKQIALSKQKGISYGVLGYCDTSGGTCSAASATYHPASLQTDDDSWKLSQHSRETLGKILIMTPVAAGLNFFAFAFTVASLVIALINRNGTVSSSLMFIGNLALSIIGFLSSTLVCIVIFLLFYPHVTWCTWLCIPAAVLSLIALPIVFLAHSGNGTSYNVDSEDELVGIVEQQNGTNNVYNPHNTDANKNLLSSNDLYQEFTGSKNSITKNPVVLPDFHEYNKPNSLVQTSTDSSSVSKEKQEYEVNEYEEKSPEPYQEDINGANAHTAYSAINSDKRHSSYSDGSNQQHLQYNGKNVKTAINENTPYPEEHEMLQNIIKDSNSKDNLLGDDLEGNPRTHHAVNTSDAGSDFTSVSQRGVNPYFYEQQQNKQNGLANNQQSRPYGAQAGPDRSNMILQNNPDLNMSNTSSQYTNRSYPPLQRGPQQIPNQHPSYQYQHGNQNYSNTYRPQQQYHQGPGYAQNQPYQGQSGRFQQRPPQQQQQPYGMPPRQNNGPRFVPAYKKRSNMRGNLPSASGMNDPYGFR